MEPQTTLYQVARKGQVIGTFTLTEIKLKLESGNLLWTDHYWTHGMGEWKPLSDLKVQIEGKGQEAAHVQDKNGDAGKVDPKDEEERLLKARVEARVAAKMADMQLSHVPKQWKCHTCGYEFLSTNEGIPYPGPSGVARAILMGALACIFAALASISQAIFAFILAIIALIFALHSLESTIALGVEKGLQQFHSYRPRCHSCSSPHCSKMPIGS